MTVPIAPRYSRNDWPASISFFNEITNFTHKKPSKIISKSVIKFPYYSPLSLRISVDYRNVVVLSAKRRDTLYRIEFRIDAAQ